MRIFSVLRKRQQKSTTKSTNKEKRIRGHKKKHQNDGLSFDVVAEFAVWCPRRDNRCAVCKNVGTQKKMAKTLQKEDSGRTRRKAWLILAQLDDGKKLIKL